MHLASLSAQQMWARSVSQRVYELTRLNQSLPRLTVSYLNISNSWIVEGFTNILWLPPDCRATCVAIWEETIFWGQFCF
jgi:hypothetical protein